MRRTVSFDTDTGQLVYRPSQALPTFVPISMEGGGPHTHALTEITGDGTMAAVNDAAQDGKARGRKDGAWAEVSEPGHSHTLPAHATLHNGGDDPVTPAGIGAATANHEHGDYQATSAKGQANGYASLGADGKVPAAQLPAASGDGEVSVLLGVDRANNTTSFADCAGLSFTALAGQTYLVEFDLVYTTNATTTGIQLGVAGNVALGLLAGCIVGFTTATAIAGRHFATYNESGKSLASSLAGSNYASVRCVFKAGASDTTLILRFAAEASTTGTSVTIKAGSVLRYRRVS